MRRRIAVAPNDNSEGKSSRFKGHAIECGQTPSTQLFEHAIVCVLLFPPPIVDLSRNKNTMTPPMPPGIQRLCFLPIDPPYVKNSALMSSTLINLPPPLQHQMLPPSDVTLPLPPFNDPLPLPTMLINTSSIPLPPSSSANLHTLSLPHITRHRMSESIGLEAHQIPQLIECAQSICRQWPSGATACLSREWCDVIAHVPCGQHALEYLCRTVIIKLDIRNSNCKWRLFTKKL